MHSAILAAAVGICTMVAYQDMRTRRIPNALTLAMAMLGLARIGLAQDVAAGGCTLAAAMMIFVVVLALFRCGIIGGGDAKMITATVLLIGHRQVIGFLFLMSLCGGILALASLATAKLDPSARRFQRAALALSTPRIDRYRIAQKRPTVPYGVAVAAAGVITLIVAR